MKFKDLKNNQIVRSELHHDLDGAPIKGKIILKKNSFIFKPLNSDERQWEPNQDTADYYAETYLRTEIDYQEGRKFDAMLNDPCFRELIKELMGHREK